MRIVLTGGGSGGHLTPLIAVARALLRMNKEGAFSIPESRNGGIEILYIGVVTTVDQALLEKAGIPYKRIPSGKVRRYISGAPLTFLDIFFRLPLGILRALVQMYVLMPEVVFSKGGYGAIPVTIAAWVYRIPVLMHETDAVPGVANRRMARFVSAIAVGLKKAEEYFPPRKVFVSGTPIRKIFSSLPSKGGAQKMLGLHERKPVIFVTGGSQGSQRINTVILELLVRLLPEFQFIHQVGKINLVPIKEFISETLANFPDVQDYHVYGFLDEESLAAAFVASDLVICRAGGTTLAELAAAGRAAILIPLRESANNHQWENAYFYREAGAAVVVDESNLSAPLLESNIRRLLQHPHELQEMALQARKLARPNATEDLAQLLVTMGLGYAPRRESVSAS